MIKKNLISFCILAILNINCYAQQKLNPIKAPKVIYRNNLPVKVLDCWQHLDIENDTLAGTSLNRAYQEILKNKNGKEVIVAVIDNYTNIHHEDLLTSIWINKNEISDNGKDDDHNGYIDDIHGWNFLGNIKGNDVVFANTESTRILKNLKKKYNHYPNFEGNKSDSLLYLKATDRYNKDYIFLNKLKKYAAGNLSKYRESVKHLEKNFNKSSFTLREFDSLYKEKKNTDPQLTEHILAIRDYSRLGKNYHIYKKTV